MTDELRLAGRSSFDSVAARYHAARPRYPDEIYDIVVHESGVPSPADVLEVGPATGIATVELARRGYRVTGIELGTALAEQARRNCADEPGVAIVNGSFDTWEPDEWGAFDLVVAATSWHWLDPVTRYDRAHRHLRPGGVLAFWTATHVVPVGGDPIFAELQEVYDEIGESLPAGSSFARPGEVADQRAEVEASGRFEVLAIRHVDWEVGYDADAYIALLDTFSGHIAMMPWQRDRLDGAIRARLARRSPPILRRHWGAVVHVARRVG